jgi:predicted PurR-regulated permease PerM
MAVAAPEPERGPATSQPDVARIAARAASAAIAVAAIAFGLWKVRSIIILLLLALTFAAAMRPGVEWLRRRRVPEPLAILFFFLLVLGAIGAFFWLAVPPALHELEQALAQPNRAAALDHSTGIRHDVLEQIDKHLRKLPSGSAILHPVAAYGHAATDAIVAVFFTLAATWFWVSERDRMIGLLTALAPETKRAKARMTYLEIDRRLGSYTRLNFLMVVAVGLVLSAGFYAVGLHYSLLVGGFVGLVEIIPVIGPLAGVLLVVAVGLPQSLHVTALALLVVVVVRMIQSYVVNPRVMGHSVGLSPLVTLISVAVVGILFGPFAVILALPATSAVATLIDVLVLDHEPPGAPAPRKLTPPRG